MTNITRKIAQQRAKRHKKKTKSHSDKNVNLSTAYQTLSALPLRNLFILLLLVGLPGVSATDDRHRDIFERYCTDNTAMLSVNKPAGSMGISNYTETFIACIPNHPQYDYSQCIYYRENAKHFNFNNPESMMVDLYRNQVELELNDWQNMLFNNADKIGMHYNEKQKLNFNYSVNVINSLYPSYRLAEAARKHGFGFCGEHLNDVLLKLVNEAYEHNLNFKIQRVEVQKIPGKNRLNHHEYLLLDSNIDDALIVKNKTAIHHLLNHADGFICDRWNNGYLGILATDQSNFYKQQANWGSLKIETIEYDLKHLKHLPSDGKKFICDNLAKIGLFPPKCPRNKKPSAPSTRKMEL